MEESSSSDALQQGVATEKADSVTMESLDVTKEVVGNVTEEASDSKLKLQRQYAVSTEDDKLPTPLPIVSGQPLENVDSITTSFNGLSIGNILYVILCVCCCVCMWIRVCGYVSVSTPVCMCVTMSVVLNKLHRYIIILCFSIATKEGDFPRLPFEGDRETMTFTSEGGELFSFVHKFRIVVPPNAVPPGNYATLHVTGYSHGPFKLPNSCKPCSDFIFVEMEGIDSFQLPVMVEISHNLIMESYTRCREVSICRCEYDGTIIALDPSHQYPIIFQKITEPEVSDNDNVFSFSLTTFCGLCAVYDVCESYKFPYLKSKTNSSDHHPLHHSQSGEYPSHHSQSGEYLLHHNHSISTDSRAPSFNSQSSCGSVECKDSPIRGGSRKRKMEESYSAGSQEKQICQLTYVLLCYWPVAYKNEVISVIIFVCRNCPTSIAVSGIDNVYCMYFKFCDIS